MKHINEIMMARVFMGGECAGEHECVSCGLSCRADHAITKTIKSNFVDFDGLMIGTGNYICQSCEATMVDPDMRFKPVLFLESGMKTIPDRADILEIIKHPPNEFVLSLPYSFKKHHWLYAGLSTNKLALIGTDSRTVEIDYTKYDVANIIDTAQQLIYGGAQRNEVITGHYSTSTRYKIPDIDARENIIAPMRQCGAVELFVKYTPACTKKIKLNGELPMITESEYKAAEILLSVALESQARVNDGMRFWGGFFERRINRLKNLELHEFVSALSDAVGASQTFCGAMEMASVDEEKQIMNDIRNKTNLMVSLVYTLNKERKK